MIEFREVGIRAGRFALDGISFRLEPGAYAVLMGRTGSGKTTILEALCGLRVVRGGAIFVAGREVTRIKPALRGIGYVPQDGALFPTQSVFENLGFALKIRKYARAAILERVGNLAAMLGIEPLLSRRIQGLSGGERQRVALGRALAFEPRVLCLDEPLSALDEDTRAEMVSLLRRIAQETGVTCLHVTHSRQEAKALASSIYEIRDGRVQLV